MKKLRDLNFSKMAAIFLYGSLLLLAILLISLDLPLTLENSDQWQIHHNEEFGFSLQFPGDWRGEIRQTYRYPDYMRAAFCSTCDTGSLRIYIWAVTDEDIFANPTKWLRELVQLNDGFNLRRKSETTIGPNAYEASVWNYIENVSFNTRIQTEAVLFVVEETVYLVEFTADEQKLDEELSQFYEILATFEVAD